MGLARVAGVGKAYLVIVPVLLIGLAGLVGGVYLWHHGALNNPFGKEQSRDRIDAVTRQLEVFSVAQGNLDGRIAGFEARLESTGKNLNDQIQQLRDDALAQRDATTARWDTATAQRDAATARWQTMRREADALADTVAGLRAELRTVGAELGRNATRRSLQEAEGLMVIADQRLQLSADVERAARALKFADRRLERLADPGLGPVREILADEIAALENAATVDVAGTLTALAALSHSVDDLPLAGDAQEEGNKPSSAAHSSATASATDTAPSDSSLWATGKNFLADLGALVQVERDGRPVAPIQSAELRLMIFEKTGLILESCQLAFLRGQKAVYDARMAAARHWVTANFDTESAEVSAWLAQWATLAAVSPEPELPDSFASLEALREVMRAGE